MNELVSLSIVVPCYNEEQVIDELYARVSAVCKRVVPDSYEIVLVNDGSSDATWGKILALSHNDKCVVGVDLSRNFGHQLALTAGLSVCGGERILVLDADLQDPPELLPDMMLVMDEGADVVYGQRVSRQSEGWFKKTSASYFYRFLFRISEVDIPLDTGDFRLMKKKVNDVLKEMPEQHRFIRGMVAWLGFRQEPIEYVREARFAGETKYPLNKMIRFAVDAITGFSVSPLRLALLLSSFFALVALVMIGYVGYSWVVLEVVPGWASTTAIVSLLGAAQLVAIGIMGEYVGRSYMESKKRPLFVVNRVVRAQQTDLDRG